jgi:hypothetical protein
MGQTVHARQHNDICHLRQGQQPQSREFGTRCRVASTRNVGSSDAIFQHGSLRGSSEFGFLCF